MRAKLSLVDRFFQVLVEEIRDNAPSYLDSSFTVAEIYQSLVPYRTHRDRIGAEMNGDYEDALLRLLAGEGEYLEMDSDTARERVRLELRSSNPNTGLYREFAAVRVRLNPEQIPDAPEPEAVVDGSPQTELGVDAGEDDLDLDDLVGRALDATEKMEKEDEGGDEALAPEPAARSAASQAPDGKKSSGPEKSAPATTAHDRLLSDPVKASGSAGRDAPKSVAGGAAAAAADSSPGVASAPAKASAAGDALQDGPAACPECAADLPSRGNLRFCPFCGVNVFVAPCGACGEELERSWSFCIACGTHTE